MRAIILSMLPYPPLPVMGKRFEENRLGSEMVISSHDIISHLLEVACVHDKHDDNQKRLQRQRTVMSTLETELKGTKDPRALYAIYCKNTAAHIACYYPESCAPELRFMPLDHCCRGDSVHRLFCDYMAAQSVIMQRTASPVEWQSFDFPSLLVATRENWVNHDSSPEKDGKKGDDIACIQAVLEVSGDPS